MAEEKDLYKILGVERDASDEDIKKAYRKLSLQYHPDKQVGKPEEEKKEAEDKFKEISNAYSVLSDPDKKRKYDMGGSFDFADFGNFHFGGMNPDDFGDFFGGIFGRGSRTRTRSYQPGSDIRMVVPLSIEDVYSGTTKKLKIRRNLRCPNCHGSKGKTTKCPHCNGTGIITETERTPFGIHQTTRPCHHCQGTGEKVTQSCPSCSGTGYKQEEAVIEVQFPAGIPNDGAIKMPGMGSQSLSPHGQDGSFIAIARYNFDISRYEIHGLDVIEHIKIPYEDCLLGMDYKLTLPDNTTINVTIPQLTESGKMLKIPGKGIEGTTNYGTKRRGDYYLAVQYELPKTLSEEEKKLLEEIRKFHSDKKD